MDYIREFDIRLEKEMYYAGETVYGVVILDTLENFKLRGKSCSSVLVVTVFMAPGYSPTTCKTRLWIAIVAQALFVISPLSKIRHNE